MKRLVPVLAALATLSLLGCGQNQAKPANASGTLAMTHDDALLYAVDTDNAYVAVLDAHSKEVVARVKVGSLPEQIVMGPDDTAYVANKGERSVSVIRRGEWDGVQTIPTAVEPSGLALSKDAKILYVVNAASSTDAEHGSLMAVDTGSRQPKWEIDLPRDPRAIALLDDEHAVISLYRSGDVVEVDLRAQKVVRDGTSLLTEVNRNPLNQPVPTEPAFPGQKVGPATVHPRAVSQLVPSPDGQKVFATLTWSSDSVLNSGTPDPSGFNNGGSTYGGDPSIGCGKSGSVVAPGIATFDSSTLAPRIDPAHECFASEARDYPASRLVSPNGEPVQGPSAAVVDVTGGWLFVANRESNNVAFVPTHRGESDSFGEFVPGTSSSVHDLVAVGHFPTGLALSSDGKTLWVHNQFDHSLTEISSRDGTPRAEPAVVYGQDVLPAAVVTGRRMFFDATDARMNNTQIGISCGSCHTDGREDGQVWNFNEGPRQTPSLAGRHIELTAPYHWGGEHPDFASFVNHTVNTRMGGTGISENLRNQLEDFIESMPTPDNPDRLAAPTDQQLRGAQVFQEAGCSTCHAGQAFTDNHNANVGTFVTDGTVPDTAFLDVGLNTPSLLGVGRTGPYLHDGSAATLKDRILQGKDSNLHGTTAALTDAQVDDLVAYLKAL